MKGFLFSSRQLIQNEAGNLGEPYLVLVILLILMPFQAVVRPIIPGERNYPEVVDVYG